MQKAFALFDFDGTLTTSDSFLALQKAVVARSPWRLLLLGLGAPLYLGTAFLKWDKRWAKSWILWSLTVGLGREAAHRRLVNSARAFAKKQGTWYPDILSKLRGHQEQGDLVVVCTASSPVWVLPMLEDVGLPVEKVVGSDLGYRFGGIVYTSPNCYGLEKNRRLQSLLVRGDVKASYSDHPSDAPMMNLARVAYVVNPKPKNRSRFQRALSVPARLLDGWGEDALLG